MIHPPDYSKEFILYVPSSITTTGMVLAQEDPNSQEHVIYYASKNLVDSETRYSRVEILALATIIAIQKFHHASHYHDTCRSEPYVLYPNSSGAMGKYSR